MKKILFLECFLFVSFIGISQNIVSYTNLFDSLFVNISKRDATTGVLYDRVSPFSNATSFNSQRNPLVDTINSSVFLQCYYELYLSLFDSTLAFLPNINEIKKDARTDSIVDIGLLHCRLNVIDTVVSRQKLYFDADSILRENLNITKSLYQEKEIFIASPLTEYVCIGKTTFVFSDDFLFDNTNNPISYINVNFDDGMGVRRIYPNTSIEVEYHSVSKHIVSIQLVFENGLTLASYSSLYCYSPKSENSHPEETITVIADIPFTDYSNHTAYGTGSMRIYYANSDRILRKPILILDGFDPKNNRKFETNTEPDEPSFWDLLYYINNGDSIHIGDVLIDNYEYDLVLLDFDNGGDYIERNAMVCVKALKIINDRLSSTDRSEQVVLIGPSMGGQIAKYALRYIEQHNTMAETNYGHHNSRLWISLDSPHQGANISLGAQVLMYYYGYVGNFENAIDSWENLLNCPAAKQMLVYQFNTMLPPTNNFQTCSLTVHQYIPNPYFSNFYNEMHAMGYPTSTRNIAITDGSINGFANNTGCSDAIDLRIKFGNIRLSKIKLFPTNYNCEIFYGMCPVGNSDSMIANFLFGKKVKMYVFANSVNNYSIDAAAGGKYKTFDIIHTAFEKNMGKKLKDGTTNIHNHCFMPITSTLDISGNMNYCTDISSRDLVEEGLIPFDSYSGVMDSNMYHVSFNQHLVEYMLNEIETYIVGLREIQLCTRPNYNLHLPQDSVATVTWMSSDNIRILTTNNPYEVSIVPLSTGDGWISAEVSTLKHRKTLAHYPIHIINNDNLTPIVLGTTIQGQSLVINNEQYLTTDTFCVENGKTMTVTGTLHCSSGTRIIVRPGGKLVVDGGVLTSSCANEMWQGIEVVGDRTKHQTASFQGVVELKNGAIIENAHCAIKTGLGDDNWHTTGGIIKADNTHFINNQRAVEFLSYVDTIPVSGALRDNYSYFNKCEFRLDNNNLFTYNDCSFIDHVTLWRVKGVKFKGCSFTNQTNEHYNRKHAIYALDAGITLDSYCSNSQIYLPTGCDCPASYSTYNSFSGFSTAVEVNTSGDQFAVRINHALFNNNETAILIKGNPFTTISRCEVNLQNVPTYTLDNRGLVLDHCSGYKVEDNTFSRTTYYPQQLVSTGIYVKNSGDSVDNFLHLNNFTNMNYGVYVKGNNGDSHYGLQITCSDFDHNGYDIFMSSGSSLKCIQGWPNLGADNDFSNTRISSIYNAGTQFVSYYHSHDVEHVPYNVTSSHVSVIDYATANGCESTLCNLGISPITPTPFMLTNFSSMMNNYISAEIAMQQSNMDGMIDSNSEETMSSTFQTEMSSLIGMRQNLSEIYYESVRALMADSSLNLNELEQWHTVAQPIADPYSLAETKFQNGNASSMIVAETMEETYNYTDLHSLKTQCGANKDGINWYELTNLQIEQLKAIAELNTGRSSVMAKGILCFIFGICYEDDWSTEEASETRSAKATLSNNETSSLVVYPNPTDNLLYVELSNSVIEDVLIYDLQGRVVESAMSLKDGFTLINVSNIPAGVYLISVTDEKGSIYHQKFVKK